MTEKSDIYGFILMAAGGLSILEGWAQCCQSEFVPPDPALGLCYIVIGLGLAFGGFKLWAPNPPNRRPS